MAKIIIKDYLLKEISVGVVTFNKLKSFFNAGEEVAMIGKNIFILKEIFL